MTVNNGANLSKEYFISYLKLVIEARSFSLEQARMTFSIAKTKRTNNYF